MAVDPFEATPPRQRTSNMVNVRLKDGGLVWIEAQMAEFGVDKSEVVKAALQMANQNPKEFAELIEKRKATM